MPEHGCPVAYGTCRSRSSEPSNGLPDLTFTLLTSADGATSVLVADVPASPMTRHLV
ncbi:hypothetical protein ACFY5K_33110 [Streptomyces griseofuscus]|uniref:hypothetical protein n=1 Tax=Streptomyces griseofuscus TaxID=146922 RepID=UPI0036749937